MFNQETLTQLLHSYLHRRTAFELIGLFFVKICVCLFSVSIVNGEPTVTVRPNAAEKFQTNNQAGGGAYIPATIKVEGPHEYEEGVLDRAPTTIQTLQYKLY